MKMEGRNEPMGVLSIYDLMRNVKVGQNGVLIRMRHLLETSQWSDVTFVVGRSAEEEETLRAHKLLLAASSPVFEAMLYGSLAESGPVRVTDLKPRTFLSLLEYVYTDESNFHEMEDAFETLYAAKKYLLPQLVTRCNEYISSLLRFSNVCFVLEFAMGIHEERLSEKCLLFIGQNAREVLSHSSFLSIKQSTLAVILDQDDLDVKSELEVLDAVLRWSTEECRRRKLSSKPCNKRKVIGPTMEKIRLLTLTAEQFLGVVGLKDILTPEEFRDVLSFLVKPNSCEVPAGVCANDTPREVSSSRRNVGAPASCHFCSDSTVVTTYGGKFCDWCKAPIS
uniref:BTB domain-containing protein n=1 Tax=Timema cristinae TaxID=61476 RepID=A0A7R9DCW7_TIMCR|nr:unnamed protein product [Timema cristinae]